jgi:transcription termination/antitermination protein NusG
MSKSWYILQARTNTEKKVLSSLRERIARSGLEDAFGDILVPEEKVIDVKDGQRKEVTRKLYPGYVFVQMYFSDAAWHVIKGTPHVLGFIGGNKKAPTPAPAADMARILAKVEESHAAPAPKLEYTPGEEVAIVEGPFKDFNGTVESVNYNQQKIKVGVSIFGRVTQVDLDFGHVAKTV